MAKISVRDILFRALCDAIDWQDSLADSLRGHDEIQYSQARDLEAEYRKLLKRRYNYDETPMQRRLRLASGKPISFLESLRRATDGKE